MPQPAKQRSFPLSESSEFSSNKLFFKRGVLSAPSFFAAFAEKKSDYCSIKIWTYPIYNVIIKIILITNGAKYGTAGA